MLPFLKIKLLSTRKRKFKLQKNLKETKENALIAFISILSLNALHAFESNIGHSFNTL
jgi:hypothetical protein